MFPEVLCSKCLEKNLPVGLQAALGRITNAKHQAIHENRTHF